MSSIIKSLISYSVKFVPNVDAVVMSSCITSALNGVRSAQGPFQNQRLAINV